MEFALPKDKSSIIKVLGVGGCGCNAVSYMFEKGITGVNFVVCNTDAQHLESRPVPNKIQLGTKLVEGLGVGADPAKGKEATLESLEEVKEVLATNTKMVFITAGMGKGTGTGGAPVIAQAAKEMGILTVGIITTPLAHEGEDKLQRAEIGIREMREHVDALLIISNDKVREIYGNLGISEAFSRANDMLANAAKGIAEIVTVPEEVNVDINDVIKVMKDSGVALMGSAVCEGEDRALKVIEEALNSPLLNDNNIKGAKKVLLNVTSGKNEITLDEIDDIMSFIQKEVEVKVQDIIWGNCKNEAYDDELSVTVIATGFDIDQQNKITSTEPEKKIMSLNGQEDEEEEILEGQTTIEFDLSKPTKKQAAKPEVETEEAPVAEEEKIELKKELPPPPAIETDPVKNQERVTLLKNLSVKLKNPTYLSEIEKEPAYKRKKVDLDDVPHSSEEKMSRFTLSDDEEDDKPILRENNSFLHDNVD